MTENRCVYASISAVVTAESTNAMSGRNSRSTISNRAQVEVLMSQRIGFIAAMHATNSKAIIGNLVLLIESCIHTEMSSPRI